MDLKAHRIRAHNDEACQQLNAGLVVIPLGVATLGQEAVTRIVKRRPARRRRRGWLSSGHPRHAMPNGGRLFHLTNPDGHELSFARLLR